MATYDKDSALQSALAAYVENADYAEADSTTKAAAFISACRRLKVLQPAGVSDGDGSSESNNINYDREIRDATVWLQTATDKASGSSVVQLGIARGFKQ